MKAILILAVVLPVILFIGLSNAQGECISEFRFWFREYTLFSQRVWYVPLMQHEWFAGSSPTAIE